MIKLDKLTKEFNLENDKIKALRDINFRIKKGEKIGLLGDSGSGKTTLLKIIMGLEYASSGSITIDGEKLSRDEFADWRLQELGFQSQHILLYPHLLLKNLIKLTRSIFNKTGRDCLEETKIREYIILLGLDKYLNHYPHELSIGQKQRFALINILIGKPNILILDEPTSALDYTSSNKLIAVIKDYLTLNNVTLILSTHDHRILKICDQIILLNNGRCERKELPISSK